MRVTEHQLRRIIREFIEFQSDRPRRTATSFSGPSTEDVRLYGYGGESDYGDLYGYGGDGGDGDDGGDLEEGS